MKMKRKYCHSLGFIFFISILSFPPFSLSQYSFFHYFPYLSALFFHHFPYLSALFFHHFPYLSALFFHHFPYLSTLFFHHFPYLSTLFFHHFPYLSTLFFHHFPYLSTLFRHFTFSVLFFSILYFPGVCSEPEQTKAYTRHLAQEQRKARRISN